MENDVFGSQQTFDILYIRKHLLRHTEWSYSKDIAEGA